MFLNQSKIINGKTRSSDGFIFKRCVWAFECDSCRAVFYRSQKSLDRKSKRCFCSEKCESEGKRGDKNPVWKTGKTTGENGYVIMTVPLTYPGAIISKRSAKVSEHRYVMQEHLGRKLIEGETVHHKDGIRHHNSIENLELRNGNHGNGATSYTEDVNRLLAENGRLRRYLKYLIGKDS